MPIDVVCPKGDYSEAEAIMFNHFVCGIAMKEENRQMKEAERKAKLNRSRARR